MSTLLIGLLSSEVSLLVCFRAKAMLVGYRPVWVRLSTLFEVLTFVTAIMLLKVLSRVPADVFELYFRLISAWVPGISLVKVRVVWCRRRRQLGPSLISRLQWVVLVLNLWAILVST